MIKANSKSSSSTNFKARIKVKRQSSEITYNCNNKLREIHTQCKIWWQKHKLRQWVKCSASKMCLNLNDHQLKITAIKIVCYEFHSKHKQKKPE